MKNDLKLAYCFLLCLNSWVLSAQSPPTTALPSDLHFEVVELPGIGPNINVESIIQDSTGYMWFATGQGLVRYDGHRTKIFTHDPLDPRSLSSNDISVLHLDQRGVLWIGTYDNGFNRMDAESELFSSYLPDRGVWSIVDDQQGNIWVGEYRGFYRLDLQSDSLRHFPIPGDTTAYDNISIQSLVVDSGGMLWVGSGSFGNPYRGLHRFDPEQESFTEYVIPGRAMSPRNGWISNLLMDGRQDIWFGCNEGLLRIRQTTREVTTIPFNPPATVIHSLTIDSNNKLWVGTRHGLYFYDPESSQQTYFEQNQAAGGLPNDIIWRMYQSRDSVYWVGTGRAGNQLFKFYDRPEKVHQHALENLQTLAFTEDTRSGNIWIGTNDGLILYDFDQGILQQYRHDPTDASGLPANGNILNILLDHQSKLWLTIQEGGKHGLYHFDPESKAFAYYPHEPDDPKSLSNERVTDLMEDRKGRLWIATYGGGLNLYDPQNDDFKHFRAEPDDPGTLSHDLITALFEDDEGVIWIGAREPSAPRRVRTSFLNRFDPETESFSHISLPTYHINRIYQDDHGSLWITGRKEVIRFAPESKALETYNSRNSDLPTDDFLASAMDHQGQLHLFSGYAIYTFNPETQHTTSLLRMSEEAPDLIHLSHGTTLMSDGTILFGSWRSGFGSLNPDQIVSSNFIELKIVDFQLLNEHADQEQSQEYVPWAIPDLSHRLVLAHSENSFAFEFFAADYRSPSTHRFEFKLENYDENWRQTGSKPEAIFHQIPPGRYVLHARMMGDEGIISRPLALQIEILAPWWQRWWAYLLFVAAVGALLYSIRDYEKRRHRKKLNLRERELKKEKELNERLQQVDLLKDQFLANTSHELRTPLQGIIGLSESLYEREEELDKQEDLSMIISSGKRLNSLVNDILDFSKLKNFDIELRCKPVNMHVLSDIVLRNNRPLLQGKDVQLINDISIDLPAVKGDEDRLQQVLYNLVGNAIKFTEKGYIRLQAHTVEADHTGSLQVRVEDTGIGIPESKREAIFEEFQQGDGSISREFVGSGLGLSISKKLVELHGGQMWLESTVGKGSSFFFTLPLSKEKASTLIPSMEPIKTIRWAATMKPKAAMGPITQQEDTVRILVVDDEPVNQQVLKNHLSGQNFHLDRAMNGEEAIRALESGDKYDLILLDIMMPRMSGYEVCQKIREKFLPSELPVIMVTAKNQLPDIVQGLSLGANDYLAKPFHKDELLARIHTQLDLHRIFHITDQFVPNEFLRSIGRDKITDVMLGDQKESEVTVLFTDIRDYTALAEGMTPEENFQFINAINGRIGPIIQKQQGFINQYLGDSIMAIFPRDPHDAISAAVDIQLMINQYNIRRTAKGRKPISVGIGLHTGTLILGITGDKNRLDATTISDTVNTASRIENLTKHYGSSILLSQDSLAKMEDINSFHLRYLGRVQVKGKTEPVGIYECYDGDKPENMASKLKSLPDFERGLEHFFAKDFPEASSAFNKVLKDNPADQVARTFVTKSANYTIEGVPDDWTGVETMLSK